MAVTTTTLSTGQNEQLRLLITPTDNTEFIWVRDSSGTIEGDNTSTSGLVVNRFVWHEDTHQIAIGFDDDQTLDWSDMVSNQHNIYLTAEVNGVPKLLTTPASDINVIATNGVWIPSNQALADSIRSAINTNNPVLLVIATSTSLVFTDTERIAAGVLDGHITHLYDPTRPEPMELVYQILSRVDNDIPAYPVVIPQNKLEDQDSDLLVFRTTGTSANTLSRLLRATIEVIAMSPNFAGALDLEKRCRESLATNNRIKVESGPMDEFAEELNRYVRHFEITVQY